MASDEQHSTLNDYRDPAIICRERGWGPGTRLVGDEGFGPTVIEITAVGENSILAKMISHAGRREAGDEGTWTLGARDWRVARAPRGRQQERVMAAAVKQAPAPERIDWSARELPVDHRTVTVFGSVWKADAPWAGLDFARAILREQASIMFARLDPREAPPDHHLDVPFCHPDDQPEGWADRMRYPVRPRRKGWRFQQINGEWRLVRPAPAAGVTGGRE